MVRLEISAAEILNEIKNKFYVGLKDASLELPRELLRVFYRFLLSLGTRVTHMRIHTGRLTARHHQSPRTLPIPLLASQCA